MKFNPYPVLLTTGALMMATVVFAQGAPADAASRSSVVASHGAFGAVVSPSTDEARHPDTRVALRD